MKSLQDFYDELEKHDWWHMMSDDSRVDRAGAANERRIKKSWKVGQKQKRFLNPIRNINSAESTDHCFRSL